MTPSVRDEPVPWFQGIKVMKQSQITRLPETMAVSLPLAAWHAREVGTRASDGAMESRNIGPLRHCSHGAGSDQCDMVPSVDA